MREKVLQHARIEKNPSVVEPLNPGGICKYAYIYVNIHICICKYAYIYISTAVTLN